MLHQQKITNDQLLSDLKIFKSINFNGAMPSPVDERDYTPAMAGIPQATQKVFPEEYEAPKTQILSQGTIGSCVAHACASAMMSGENLSTNTYLNYSRGYIYGNRKDSDYQGEGMFARQALSQLVKCGDVEYQDFPYNKTYPEVKELIDKNRSALLAKALKHTIKNYYRCTTEQDIKEAVYEHGGCIICVPVYESFSRDLHRPKSGEQHDGYHAMLIVGWNKDRQWIVQNSWGVNWGYSGKLLMDFDYPVNEYWGITVQETESKKKNWFTKLIDFIVFIFRNIKNVLVNKPQQK